MPVYVITISHLPFAIASQAVIVAEGFNTTAIIGGLCGSVVVICLMAALFLYVRRISKASEMEGGDSAIKPNSIKSLTLRVCRAGTRCKLGPVAGLADGQPLEPAASQSPFSSPSPEGLTL
jgi:hypothetical protein